MKAKMELRLPMCLATALLLLGGLSACASPAASRPGSQQPKYATENARLAASYSPVSPALRERATIDTLMPAFATGPMPAYSVFASQATASNVLAYPVVFPPGGQPYAVIDNTYAVQGIALDGTSLLVAAPTLQEIAIYSPRYHSWPPDAVLDDALAVASDPTVGADGKIYVANILTDIENTPAPGDAVIYKQGANRPTSVLRCRKAWQWIGIAVDARGDVFANVNRGKFAYPELIEFPAGSKRCQVLANVQEQDAGGLAIDSQQHLVVLDQNTGIFDVYAPPYTGSPISSFSFPNGGGGVFFAIDPRNSYIYLADVVHVGVDVLKYPSGTYVGRYRAGLGPPGVGDLIGVAVR